MAGEIKQVERSDAEIAEDLKKRIIEVYKPFIEIIEEARKQGFQITVQCGPGPMGNMLITQLIVAKHF